MDVSAVSTYLINISRKVKSTIERVLTCDHDRSENHRKDKTLSSFFFFDWSCFVTNTPVFCWFLIHLIVRQTRSNLNSGIRAQQDNFGQNLFKSFLWRTRELQWSCCCGVCHMSTGGCCCCWLEYTQRVVLRICKWAMTRQQSTEISETISSWKRTS